MSDTAAWDEAMVRAGCTDPRSSTPRASRRALARRITEHLGRDIPVHTSTVSAVIDGKVDTEYAIIEAASRVLGTREVFAWVGARYIERRPYRPPSEVELLTERQQRLVTELIKVLALSNTSGQDGPENPVPVDPSRPTG